MTSTEEVLVTKRSWRTRLAIVLISLSVGGILAEILVRIRYGTPTPERLPLSRVEANPYRGWQMVPGENHYTYQHLVEINALGLRGPETPEAPLPGERRILALGDSMIYGQGVASDSTLPAQLERVLQENVTDDTRWRVINGGHRAYATNQELGLLAELGPRLRPQIVILFWYDNDFEEYDIQEVHAELSNTGPRTFDVGAVLEGRVLLKWKLKQVLRRSALAMIVHDRLRDGLDKGHDQQFFERGFEILEERLTQFEELCALLGSQPVFVVIPHASTLRKPGPIADRAKRVQEVVRARGIPLVELLPGLVDLCRELDSLPILPYDGHYLAPANRRMAEILAPKLTALP